MKALITTLSTLFIFLSLEGQYIYFEEYAPFEEWEQAAGAAQIEISEGGYTIVCSPDAGNGFGFGILEMDNNALVESSHFFETGGLSANGNSDTFLKTSDGGHLYAGDESLRQWVVKFNENNNIEWEYFFPYNVGNTVFFSSVNELSDGYLFSGKFSSEEGDTENSLFLFKTSLEGDSLWFREVDSQQLYLNSLTDVLALDDGHLLISGSHRSTSERFLMKVGPDGLLEDEESNFHFFNQQIPNQLSSKMIRSNSGNEVIAYAKTDEESWNGLGEQGSNYQFSILEFDGENMEVVNEVTYPTLYEDHIIADFHQTPDGGYAIFGIHGYQYTRSFIKKVDADLEEEWIKYYAADIPSELTTYATDFEITEDGGFIVVGLTASSAFQDYPPNLWLLKLDACGDGEDLGCEFIDNVSEVYEAKLSVYPNPTRDKFMVKFPSQNISKSSNVLLRNALGQKVFMQTIGASFTEIDVSSIPSGIYMLSLVSDGRELYSERLIIE